MEFGICKERIPNSFTYYCKFLSSLIIYILNCYLKELLSFQFKPELNDFWYIIFFYIYYQKVSMQDCFASNTLIFSFCLTSCL